MIEPTQLELDERQNSYEAGYITGISDERERIINILKQMNNSNGMTPAMVIQEIENKK